MADPFTDPHGCFKCDQNPCVCEPEDAAPAPKEFTLSSMDIYSPRGTKVIFDSPDNGYTHDQEKCRKHLKVGATYTVDHTDVYSSSTNVWLQEVPGEHFNSVMFSAVPDEAGARVAGPFDIKPHCDFPFSSECLTLSECLVANRCLRNLPEPVAQPCAGGEPSMTIGEVINRTLKMWEEAKQLHEMAAVRFDVAAEILVNTWSIEEQLLTSLPSAGGPRLYDKAEPAAPAEQPQLIESLREALETMPAKNAAEYIAHHIRAFVSQPAASQVSAEQWLTKVMAIPDQRIPYTMSTITSLLEAYAAHVTKGLEARINKFAGERADSPMDSTGPIRTAMTSPAKPESIEEELAKEQLLHRGSQITCDMLIQQREAAEARNVELEIVSEQRDVQEEHIKLLRERLAEAEKALRERLERALADAKEINGYAVKDDGGMGERLLKVAAHTAGTIVRLERELNERT